MFSYRVKVVGTKYLHGGQGILPAAAAYAPNLSLVIRVDELGEPVAISVRLKDDTTHELGNLAPGECLAVEVGAVLGVFATCDFGEDTHIECSILPTYEK